jgi:hypothetical protein
VGGVVTPFERRRADRFAELVDGRAPAPHGDRELSAMLGTAAALSATRAPAGATIDPAYRDRLRTRLVAVMDVQGVAPASPPVRRRRIPRRVVIAGPALAGVLALSGVGAASSGAVPGDALYGVKRSTESAQLTLATSDVNRGRLFLDFARKRMAEATAVAADEAALRKSLDDMDEASRNGVRLLGQAAVDGQDRAPLDAIDGFVLAQRADLTSVVPRLDLAQRDRALDSLVLLEQIQARSLELRGSLLCTTGYADQGGSDALGPLPQRCAALRSGSTPGGTPLPGATVPSGTPLPGEPTAARGIPSGIPSLPGLGGVTPSGTGLPTPGLPGAPSLPGIPGAQEGDGGPGGLLGTVTGTVGGVVGGLLGPLLGDGDNPSPSPTPSPSPSAPAPHIPGLPPLIPRR